VQQTVRTYNILVVEDNSNDAALIREAFAECGKACDIAVADSNEKAKQLLDSQNFDLIICDIGFRGEEGADFIRSVRSHPRLKTLPTIVLSGSSDSRLAYEAGANALIAKTMDVESFIAKLRVLVHFWLEVVELPRARSAE
jgi:CheY-like chemotaxis protein